jgi:hypothetical protein
VTCEPVHATVTPGGVAPPPPVSAGQVPSTAASAMVLPASLSNTDSVALDSVVPKPGTYLKRGIPVTFNLGLSYNLVSADSAILSISTVQLRTSTAGCHGGNGELVDAVQAPIVRGRHQVQTKLAWSGDTGSTTRGRIYGSGYLSFSPMFWANNNGSRGARLDFFGTYAGYCYQFGP